MDRLYARAAAEAGQSGAPLLRKSALEPLLSFGWPGNLRQLDNVRLAYAMALMDGIGLEGVELRRDHFDASFRYESSGPMGAEPARGLSILLKETARFYAIEAQHRSKDSPLGLELAEAFQGTVLMAAAEVVGGKRQACLMLGLERVVEGRNHGDLYKWALTRLRSTLQALGEPPDPELELVLGAGGEVEGPLAGESSSYSSLSGLRPSRSARWG